jgi:hypothetical protein
VSRLTTVTSCSSIERQTGVKLQGAAGVRHRRAFEAVPGRVQIGPDGDRVLLQVVLPQIQEEIPGRLPVDGDAMGQCGHHGCQP